jgi:hypothetical protein
MTFYQPFLFFFILIVLSAYWRCRERAAGRRGLRHITGYGVVFCVLSLNLWFMTRFEDILAGFPRPHQASIFATPWLWVSALCVGVTLLVISFFTRKSRQHAA